MDAILPSQGDNIIRTKDLDENYDKHGLASMLFNAMIKHKTKIAQIDAQTGRMDTYEIFLQKSIKVAKAIRSLGIKTGDIVCFCSENQCDVYISYVGALLVGAITSALDPAMSKADMKHLLAQVPPKLIFTTPKCEELLEEVIKSLNLTPDMVIFGQTDKHTPFDDFIVKDDGDFNVYEVHDIFKTAIIFFSSGTTGLPKGICLNHYSLMCNAITTGPSIMDGADVVLGFSTVYWISSILIFLSSVIDGMTRLLTPGFDPEKIWCHIGKYKVNMICCATNQGVRLFKTPIPKGTNLTNLKTLLIGGAKVPKELMQTLKEKLPMANVRQAYGMTELGGLCTVQEAKDANNLATCGRIRQGFWYKVVNSDNEEILGPNKPGELRLKTKLQMNGYYNIDSSDAWDKENWLKTGDIVFYDEDYFFYFVDRLKAVIKYRGIHVPSTMLEELLLAHPAVEEAAVIGLPHPDDEEHPMAVVVLTHGAGNVSEEELRSYVDDQVDDPKKLRGGVKIVQELPMTPTGKFNKRELKARICEEMKIGF